MKTRAKFPYLIEIVNSDLGTFRYANCSRDVPFEDNTYTAGLFSITPPEQTSTSISNAKLTLSCVDQTWIKKIRSTQNRSTMRFIASILYDGTCEALEDNTFTLTIAEWDESNISWTMVFDDNMNILVPPDIASSQNTPASA
jgi:hypothetical protein